MKYFVLLIFISIVFANSIFAQDKTLQISDCSTSQIRVGFDNSKCVKPIIWGKKEDGFPDKIKIKGIVTKVTLVQISCGVLCHFGTAEIKLLTKPKGYKYDFIYVTVLCFSGKKEEYLNRIIEQEVLKTNENHFKKYYCGGVYNFIDSNGTPFYDLLGDKNRINGRLKFTETKPTTLL